MTDGAAAQTREPLKNGGTRNLANPLWCFHGFRLCVIILTIFGVIMVFSSSTVTMAALGKSPFLQLLNQGAFCLIGLVLGFVALMMPCARLPGSVTTHCALDVWLTKRATRQSIKIFNLILLRIKG